MASRGAASVAALHDRLYTRSLLPHLHRDLPYEPHITLARQPDPRALEAAFVAAREQLEDEFEEVLREVTLVAVAEDGRIKKLRTIALHTA